MSKPIINAVVGGVPGSKRGRELRNVIVTRFDDFVAQVTTPDTIYEIRWNFDLHGQTLEVPDNCVFDFRGGKLFNGSIVWNDTKIINLYDYTILENIESSGQTIPPLAPIDL